MFNKEYFVYYFLPMLFFITPAFAVIAIMLTDVFGLPFSIFIAVLLFLFAFLETQILYLSDRIEEGDK